MERVPRGFQTAVDVEHGPRMVVLPYVRILLKFSTTKNGLAIILEVLCDGECILALWKYDFYGDSLLPIVTREHFVKLVRWEQM